MATNSKEKILYFRESAIQSIIADAFMFGGILGLLYFNHRVLNGNSFIDLIFILLMLIAVIGRQSNRYKRFNSYKELQNYINREAK